MDSNLFNICQKIPTKYLIRNSRAAVLRESVRNLSLSEIIDNPQKVGFNVPLLDYLDINNPDVYDQLVSDSQFLKL